MLLRETYAPVLQLSVPPKPSWTTNRRTPSLDTHGSQSSLTSLLRRHSPTKPRELPVLSTSVILLSIYSTIFNCYIYLLYTTLSTVFGDTYRLSANEIDPAYLGLGSGMAVGVLYLLFVYPQFALSTRSSRDLESLIWMIVPAAVVMPIAILLYGWSLHFAFNQVVPVVATGLMGAAFLTTFVSRTRPQA